MAGRGPIQELSQEEEGHSAFGGRAPRSPCWKVPSALQALDGGTGWAGNTSSKVQDGRMEAPPLGCPAPASQPLVTPGKPFLSSLGAPAGSTTGAQKVCPKFVLCHAHNHRATRRQNWAWSP